MVVALHPDNLRVRAVPIERSRQQMFVQREDRWLDRELLKAFYLSRAHIKAKNWGPPALIWPKWLVVTFLWSSLLLFFIKQAIPHVRWSVIFTPVLVSKILSVLKLIRRLNMVSWDKLENQHSQRKNILGDRLVLVPLRVLVMHLNIFVPQVIVWLGLKMVWNIRKIEWLVVR